jgi:hypothetical protein
MADILIQTDLYLLKRIRRLKRIRQVIERNCLTEIRHALWVFYHEIHPRTATDL